MVRVPPKDIHNAPVDIAPHSGRLVTSEGHESVDLVKTEFFEALPSCLAKSVNINVMATCLVENLSPSKPFEFHQSPMNTEKGFCIDLMPPERIGELHPDYAP
jgi:hypothetical protein